MHAPSRGRSNCPPRAGYAAVGGRTREVDRPGFKEFTGFGRYHEMTPEAEGSPPPAGGSRTTSPRWDRMRISCCAARPTTRGGRNTRSSASGTDGVAGTAAATSRAATRGRTSGSRRLHRDPRSPRCRDCVVARHRRLVRSHDAARTRVAGLRGHRRRPHDEFDVPSGRGGHRPRGHWQGCRRGPRRRRARCSRSGRRLREPRRRRARLRRRPRPEWPRLGNPRALPERRVAGDVHPRDPRRTRLSPAPTAPGSPAVVVADRSTARAEVLANAAFVAGRERGADLLARFGVDGWFIPLDTAA